MSKSRKSTIEVQGKPIAVLSEATADFISLTDIAKFKNPDHSDDVIRNWLRNRNTVEFLGVWERLNNPAFNPVEFDGIRIQTGLNSFSLTPKQWIEKTGAMGLSQGDRLKRLNAIAIRQMQTLTLGQNDLRRLQGP